MGIFIFAFSFFALIYIGSFYRLKKRIEKLEKINKIQNIEVNKNPNLLAEKGAIRASEELIETQKKYSKKLVPFIEQQFSVGASELSITNSLLKHGWNGPEIKETIDYIKAGLLDKNDKEKITTTSSAGNFEDNPFIEWVKDDWLMKLGALLFIIGIGWFVTYAFMNNWIGPIGRITLGLLSGAGILAFGATRIRNYKNQGDVLLALGAAVVTITAIAGREMYNFFTPVSELGIIFLATFFVAFVSVKYKSKALATLAIVWGYVAPSFVGGISGDLSLFVYLFIISAATLWVAAFTGWRFLASISLALIALFSILGSIPENIVILFTFAALFFVTNIAAVIKSRNVDKADILTAAGLSTLLIYWIISIVPDIWQSLWTTVWAVFFVVASFIASKTVGLKEPVYVYSAIALAMLGVATAMELSGAALVIAYVFEIAAVVYISTFISVKIAHKLSALFVIPIVLSLGSLNSPAWDNGILHQDFFVLVSISAVLLIIGVLLALKKKSIPDLDIGTGNISAAMIIVGSLYALAILWLSLHAVFTREIATTVSLVVYTLLGMGIYIKGKLGGIDSWRISGAFLLGFVVLRLLLVEAWRLDMSGKIVIFLLIGALLVATAFVGRSQKGKITQ